MGQFFGFKPRSSLKEKRPKAALSDRDRAVLDLKIARDRLTKYRKRVRTTVYVTTLLSSL